MSPMIPRNEGQAEALAEAKSEALAEVLKLLKERSEIWGKSAGYPHFFKKEVEAVQQELAYISEKVEAMP